MKIVRGVADVKRCTETNVIIVVFRLTGTTRLGTAPPRPPPLRTTIISHRLREAAATSSAADCSFTLEVPAHFRTVEVEAFVHATHAAGDTRASMRQSTRQPTSWLIHPDSSSQLQSGTLRQSPHDTNSLDITAVQVTGFPQVPWNSRENGNVLVLSREWEKERVGNGRE